MSQPERTDVEKLIGLKRYEKPSEEFLDRFMAEFQNRQRSEMLMQSAHGLFFERLSTWAWGFGRWKWVYAGGAASALAISGGIFLKTDATSVTGQFQNQNTGVQQVESTELAEEVVKEASKKAGAARSGGSGGLRE